MKELQVVPLRLQIQLTFRQDALAVSLKIKIFLPQLHMLSNIWPAQHHEASLKPPECARRTRMLIFSYPGVTVPFDLPSPAPSKDAKYGSHRESLQ